MAKQSSFFGNTSLHRAYDLAGPAQPSRRELRASEDQRALGGMRRPDLSVRRNAGYRKVGQKLRAALEQYVDSHPQLLELARSLRRGSKVEGFDTTTMSEIRSLWLRTLGATEMPASPGPDADVLQAWGRATDDPDARSILPTWLRDGAPLGIIEDIEAAGVFPSSADNSRSRRPEALHTELAGWSNYKSADDEPDVVSKLLGDQRDKQHCVMFDTYEELLEFLGSDEAVLSKIALITKLKADGSTKHRLIWDLLRSEVNESISLSERLVLPRLQDAVEDAQALLQQGYKLEWLVLDIADAFHNVPIKDSERKYMCGKFGGKYIAFKVLCMGGKSSPNIWGRFAAAMGRILASIFFGNRSPSGDLR